MQKRIQFLLDYGIENHHVIFRDMDVELDENMAELDEVINLICELNEPSVMEIDRSLILKELAGRTFFDYNNEIKEILNIQGINVLSIKRRSLDDRERLEIESHVNHTFNFLSKVPWTKDIQNIPEIAVAHHEKLNGDGYPNDLTSSDFKRYTSPDENNDDFRYFRCADRSG